MRKLMLSGIALGIVGLCIGGYMLYRHFFAIIPGWHQVSFRIDGEEGPTRDAYVAEVRAHMETLCQEQDLLMGSVSITPQPKRDPWQHDSVELTIWVFVPPREEVRPSEQGNRLYEKHIVSLLGHWKGGVACRRAGIDLYEESKLFDTRRTHHLANSPEQEEESRRTGFPVNLEINLKVVPAE